MLIPLRKFWKVDEGRSQEPESPAPLVHWLCGLGLGLARTTWEMGSQQLPPHRDVGRTQEYVLSAQK